MEHRGAQRRLTDLEDRLAEFQALSQRLGVRTEDLEVELEGYKGRILLKEGEVMQLQDHKEKMGE